ncbi:MAG: Rrf2 family transcriptional regulator [Candidatus Manganitrophaceae bacterium]
MVRLSAKSEYALLALLALSLHLGEEPLRVRAIAQKEKIPIRFLEQVMNLLKKQGLVESIRGPHGGYRLAKDPEQIRLGEVLQAVEGPFVDFDRSLPKGQAPFGQTEGKGTDSIIFREVLDEVHRSLKTHLDSINFKDLCERKRELEEKQTLMFHI